MDKKSINSKEVDNEDIKDKVYITKENQKGTEKASSSKGSKFILLLVLLQFMVILYTMSGVAAKFASKYDFMSFKFLLCYGIEIGVLCIYAIFWQQIIKRIDLSVAYANRGLAILWSMIWAVIFFGERVTIKNIIGVIIVIIGIITVNKHE